MKESETGSAGASRFAQGGPAVVTAPKRHISQTFRAEFALPRNGSLYAR